MAALDEQTRDFEAAVGPVLGPLYASALRLCRDRTDAEDLVQDAVLRAWRFWPGFERGTNLRAWLSRILRHCFVDGYHRRRRERDVLLRVRAETAREHARDLLADDDALSDEVEASIAALPDEFRSVLRLVALEDCTYHEAATRLGCPVGTVMSRLHRARSSLRADLGGYAAQMGYC